MPTTKQTSCVRALLVAYDATTDKRLFDGPANNLQLMRKLLEDGFKDVRIKTLDPRKKRTQKAVLKELASLINSLKHGDKGLFYFAGHGEQHPTEKRTQGISLSDKTLWDKGLVEVLSNVPDRSTCPAFLVVADCCHAGGFLSLDNKKNFLRKITHKLSHLNVALLAACCEKQVISYEPLEDRKNYGRLTFYLNQVLRAYGWDLKLKEIRDQIRKHDSVRDEVQSPQLRPPRMYSCRFFQTPGAAAAVKSTAAGMR